MEKLNKPQEIYVRQRTWATVFFAFLSLIFLVVVILLPIAFAITTPEDNLTEGQVTAVIVVASCAAGLFGVPLAVIFVALCVKLRHKFVIYADERGIYLYSTIISYGLIPWKNISEIQYYSLFGYNSEILAPDTNHLKIGLKDKSEFVKGLNFLQKAFFKINFSRLYCNMALCRGKGENLSEELNNFLKYYTGDNDSVE